MNTAYSEKLRDPRWKAFREESIQHHGNQCKTCGQFTSRERSLHVHHKRYGRNLEPWDYPFSDVVVLCEECHDRIHECETVWRNKIRTMPPWVAGEWIELLNTLTELDDHTLANFAARARNLARDLQQQAAYEE
jgi:hypothetical protein